MSLFNYTLTPREVFDDAIKALEQEPCEDYISREALLNRLRDFTEWCQDGRLQGALFASDVVADMPSVQPKTEPRRKGKWEHKINKYGAGCFKCSICGYWHPSNYHGLGFKYCNNCGADMREE